MRYILERRAEVALRSLPHLERQRFDRAIASMLELSPQEIASHGSVRLLGESSQSRLYSYRSSATLRIIFSIGEDLLIVQDILNRHRVRQIFGTSG